MSGRRARGAALLALVLASAALGVPRSEAATPGWWERAPLAVVVHQHAFHRVTANSIGCIVRVRLYFTAPEAAYAEPAAARNHYRFRAQVKLSGGNVVLSEPFGNAEAGARVFAFSYDTTREGCWAQEPRKLRKVDVQACRGERCTPAAFE